MLVDTYIIGAVLDIDDVESDSLHLRRRIVRKTVRYTSIHGDLYPSHQFDQLFT